MVDLYVAERAGREVIEVRNESDGAEILVSACRSRLTGRLYVHFGPTHGRGTRVGAGGYALVDVEEVDS